jgi:ribokinase
VSNEAIVVGSVNADHIMALARRPAGGETVLATSDTIVTPGGKGANQAPRGVEVRCQYSPRRSSEGRPFGADQLEALRMAGVEPTLTKVVGGCRTGAGVPDGSVHACAHTGGVPMRP